MWTINHEPNPSRTRERASALSFHIASPPLPLPLPLLHACQFSNIAVRTEELICQTTSYRVGYATSAFRDAWVTPGREF